MIDEINEIQTQAHADENGEIADGIGTALLVEQQSNIAVQSITPSIAEIERFISFLNQRLSLGLNTNDLTLMIQQTSPKTKGHFRPKENTARLQKENENGTEPTPLNEITLSSYHLTTEPYETIAHELAHYINHTNKIKDCSGSQYHNKRFKEQAEKLLLEVKKLDNSHGYAFTFETQAFKELLKEFKPNENAFKIFQAIGKPNKSNTRLLLYMCGCGCKIRTARNEGKPLNAVCQYCNTKFELQED